MTVQELINKLQEIPDKDMEIAIDDDWAPFDITGIRLEETMVGECYLIYHD